MSGADAPASGSSADAAAAKAKEPKQGEPVNALAPLGEALVKAAKVASADTADPLVSISFALGWQMAELFRPQHGRGERHDGDLPGLSSLSDDERVEISVDQIQAGVTKLSAKIEASGLPAVDLGPLTDSIAEGDSPAGTAVETVHERLLSTLTATDFRFGKAYGLGRALADTCRKPGDGRGLKDELKKYRMANLRAWLDDLSSAFPAHAAHSVDASIVSWVQWAEGVSPDSVEKSTLTVLRRQGELWRALLSGEKRGTEMLEIDDYLDAARKLADQMHVVLRGVVKRFPFVVWSATGLLALGIGLLVIGSGSTIVAGAGSILAALGLTWKGLGGALGQLAGKLEQPLWGAVLDRAIAKAITLEVAVTEQPTGRLEVALDIAHGRGDAEDEGDENTALAT